MKTAQIIGKDGMGQDDYFLLRNSENPSLDGIYVYSDDNSDSDDQDFITFSTTNQYGTEYSGDDVLKYYCDDPKLALERLGYEVIGIDGESLLATQRAVEHIDESWEQAAKRKQNEIWNHICH